MGRAPAARLQGEDSDCGGVAAAHYRGSECLDHRVINNAVKQWHKSVAANGGHFEHLL